MKKLDTAKKSKRLTPPMIIALSAVIVLALAAVCLAVIFSDGGEQAREDGEGLVSQIKNWSGYTRVVSAEEVEFFKPLVKRNLSEQVGDEQLEQLTKEYINRVSAKFYLSNKLGLCEPYDFATMQYRMEQENTKRQAQLQQDEPVYGPESFTLETYFQYIYSKLDSDIIDYLYANADDEIIESARQYLEDNPQLFTGVDKVTYTVTEDGKTEEYTKTAREVSEMRNTDGQLNDFLSEAENGDTFEYEQNGVLKSVTLLSKTYKTSSFEEDADAVVRTYISSKLLDELVDSVAENNPVEFK